MGSELLHADGQTDMTKLIVTFRNFSNVLKTVFQRSCCSFALEDMYEYQSELIIQRVLYNKAYTLIVSERRIQAKYFCF